MMKAGELFFVGFLFLLLIVPVTASGGSLADVACSWLGLFCWDDPPVVVQAFLNKGKFVLGEQMIVTAAVEDGHGVDKVTADIEFEDGTDTINLILIAGDNRKGTWRGTWKVHGTLCEKKYHTTVTAVDSKRQTDKEVLTWVDPQCTDPGHCASQVGGGVEEARRFQDGVYTFPGDLAVGNNLDVYNIYFKTARDWLLDSGGRIKEGMLPY